MLAYRWRCTNGRAEREKRDNKVSGITADGKMDLLDGTRLPRLEGALNALN